MATEENINVDNLEQTIVQYPFFSKMINSIFAATYQEQSCLLLRLKSQIARRASQHPAFVGNCQPISDTCWPHLPSR